MTKKMSEQYKGFLLVDKSIDYSSFYLIKLLRKLTSIKKIGHAGTLDPFASGLMILLIGKDFTTKSDQFINLDKEYFATLHLGVTTDTFDTEGKILSQSDTIPSLDQIKSALLSFNGTIEQMPPMFSAKKVQGKKLYELARKGIEIERKKVKLFVKTELVSYKYPYLNLNISCSKGTYIRSIADDLGKALDCGAHLSALKRTRIGPFELSKAISQEDLQAGKDFREYLLQNVDIT